MSTLHRRLLAAALGCLALAALGCEPAPDVEPLPCRIAEAGVSTLGEGDLSTGYLELDDGQDLAVSFGPQGMHMVFVSARISNMEPAQAGGIGNRVSVAIRLQGEVVGGTVADMKPSVTDGGISDFLGIRAIITAAEVEDLDGQVTDVEVIVRDGCGRELAADRPLRLVL